MIDLMSATIRRRRGMMVALVFPLGFWSILWLGIAGEYPDISGIVHPENPLEFGRGIAAVAPFAAAGSAMALILYRLEALARIKVLFLGPLGFATIYGSVGFFSAINSPDASMALYWAGAYLTVPIVLWSITLVGEAEDQLRLIITFTWALISAAAVILLAFGLIKLSLWNVLTHPDIWLKCTPQGWYNETSHLLRETGVGRYAAIAGIVALSGLWQRNWRFVWAGVFLISIFLLITSGARTSVVGFLVGVPVVILLQGGKKAAAASVVAGVLLIPIFWSTGIHQTFLDYCIWRNPPSPVVQPATEPVEQISDSLVSVPLADPESESNPAGNTSVQHSDANTAVDNVQPAGTVPAGDPVQPADAVTPDDPIQVVASAPPERILGQIPSGYLKLNGRTAIWSEAWGYLKDSPFLGYGFHADRLLIGQHTHNSYLHALLQTGFIGGVAFMAALLFTLFHLVGIVTNLNRYSSAQKKILIGSAGILVFLSVRTITESTGAFFSVDWLIIAPLLLYVQIMNRSPIRDLQ